jgi:hypothetical protein
LKEAAMTETDTAEPSAGILGRDIIRGAANIAKFLFGDERRRRSVYHLAEDARGVDRIPTFHLCGVICARKSDLTKWADRLLARATVPTPVADASKSLQVGSVRRGRGRPRKAA